MGRLTVSLWNWLTRKFEIERNGYRETVRGCWNTDKTEITFQQLSQVKIGETVWDEDGFQYEIVATSVVPWSKEERGIRATMRLVAPSEVGTSRRKNCSGEHVQEPPSPSPGLK
jgi:hypothetical protein